jgi:hypothetical protein
MSNVFLAIYGEYEEPLPIGVYDTLEKAKEAVVNSNPSYDTEVEEYDPTTGRNVATYYYNKVYKTKSWEWRERTINK